MSSLVAATSSSSGSSLLVYALPVLLIAFMFFSSRRRQRAAQTLQSTLGVGDEITTTSGLLGRITTLDDKVVTLEVSPGVNIRFDRRAISGPAPDASLNDSASIDSASSESETDLKSDPSRVTD
ncbi:MAG: preprotein translocase subunit YajC [Actinomycetota bacterium]|nr:preprotein translocase subunit YajC [Actinomycetota bacterium]